MSRLRASHLDRAFLLVAGLVEQGETPAAVLAVADSRRTIRTEAFGSQDGAPITAGVISPIFSVTKPMVATAVTQLWERGLLNLHEPVASYL